MNIPRLIRLLALEYFSRDTLQRAPEPTLVMDAASHVEAFDQVGQETLTPLYHFNALAMSRLLPKGGRLLDLGSGSGRLLAYLAKGRPDVEIIGLELSAPMVEVGNKHFKEAGIYPQVRLEIGDMTRLVDRKLDRIDVISINLALEHLPDFSAVQFLMDQIKQLIDRWGCGFWLFNHSRPKTQAAAQLFPEVFTPDAPQSFREDSRNSLIASWRLPELMPVMHSTLGKDVQGRVSRLLPYYLVFWLESLRRPAEGLWVGGAQPPGVAGQQFKMFRAIYFPDVPLD